MAENAIEIHARLQRQLLKRKLDKSRPNRRLKGFGARSPRRSLRKDR